jgi:glycosyltransferase involved in cell wall biosynthesis
MDLQLVITGKSDPHYPEVKNAVKKYRLEEDVIFPGMLNEIELNHLYNGALTYVFPSLYEGFGLPPLEAMRCGTPVIASNTSSVPEICGQGNALFFDPYSSEDMVEKIMKLYTNADLQAELIARGIDRSSKFPWETTAQKTYELIKKSI